jgi:hypothetical protein
MKIKNILVITFIIFIGFFASAQLKAIEGKIIANDEVEGIHILNKTALKFTVTDLDGSFEILAKASDTLTISSLKYKKKELVLTKAMIDLGFIQVKLEEKINELDEVVVGRIFTGNLGSDLKNTKTKDELNFYDLGIPGYIGKPLTQNERKLKDADEGKVVSITGGPFGGGVGLNLHKLLNIVSGRTKKLKEIVRLDANEKCIRHIKDEYTSVIFEKETLADSLKIDYFYFCSDDANFVDICKIDNGVVTIAFLKEKLKAYKANRNSTNDN